jgi:hypothetical protein
MNRFFAAARIAVLAAAVSAFATPSSAQGNLLVNPGFEDGGGSYDGWFTFGSGVQLSLPGGDDIIRSGVAASKIFGEFTGCPSPNFDVGGYGQAFAAPTIGATYELSGWVFVSSADPMFGADQCLSNRFLAKVVFFDAAAGGSEISSNELIIGGIDTVQDQWNPFSVTAIAPPGAQRVEALFLFLQPGCDTGAAYVDDTSFRELPTPSRSNVLVNPSFDTDLSGWNIFGNVFHEGRNIIVRTPPGSAKLFSTFDPGSDSGMFQSFPASPGSIWELVVNSLVTCQDDPITGANDNFLLARLVFRDGGGTEIGAVDQTVADATSPLGTWTRNELVGLAPAGTATVDAYILFVSPTQMNGSVWVDDIGLRQSGATDAPVVTRSPDLDLRQNFPNPFAVSTRIDFVLKREDTVDVSVYDIAGRRVVELFRGPVRSGTHRLTWDGRTEEGTPAASGIYRCVLRTSDGKVSRNMMLLR